MIKGLPFKNTAIGLLFCVFLGPIGLLYASFRGGVAMIIIGIVVISSKLPFPIILLWIVCCIWSVKAIESYNRKLLLLSQSE
jgi:hypothetical protein